MTEPPPGASTVLRYEGAEVPEAPAFASDPREAVRRFQEIREVEVEGLIRLRVPAVCGEACPAADVLTAIRAVPGVCE